MSLGSSLVKRRRFWLEGQYLNPPTTAPPPRREGNRISARSFTCFGLGYVAFGTPEALGMLESWEYTNIVVVLVV